MALWPLHSPRLGLATVQAHAGLLPAELGAEGEFVLVFQLRHLVWPCVLFLLAVPVG